MIEMLTQGQGAGPNRGQSSFWLGRTGDSGLAIWLNELDHPQHQFCYTLAIPQQEIKDIDTRLLHITLGTGPSRRMDIACVGFISVRASSCQKIAMKWWDHPAESWSQVFQIVDEIQVRILSSPNRIELPPRHFPSL